MRKESQKTLGIWIKLRQANATASKARTRTGHAINHTPSTHDKHKTESTPRFRRAVAQSRRTGIDHASRREGKAKGRQADPFIAAVICPSKSGCLGEQAPRK
jgi:hypothetical protein